MHKTTALLALSCFVLAIITGIVARQLYYTRNTEHTPLDGGSNIYVGIPEARPQAHIQPVTFSSNSALLLDTSNDTILFEQNAFERRPIASITKLMTAMIALDHGIPWDKEVTIRPEENVHGARLVVHTGESLTMKDLFYASLAGSANNATIAYVREIGVPQEEFVREMNRRAIALGLEQTVFTDITGLDPENISTAYEVALLAHTAFSQYPEIAEATSQKEYSFTFRGTGREHTIRNTNKMVSEWGEQVTGSKTGYLHRALFCLVMQGAGGLSDRIAVILGAPSEHEQSAEMNTLLQLPVP